VASAVCCPEPAAVVEEELPCFAAAVEPSCATWLAGVPPHADTSSDGPTSAEAKTSARDRRSAFTRSMIALPNNNARTRR
jgi:hypothetical protein